MRIFLVILCAVFLLSSAAVADPFSEAQHAYDQKDYEDALRILRPLADQGYAEAQYDIGDLYNRGLGVGQSYAEALKWFRKAAEEDHLKAQEKLGELYESGKGVKQDYPEAYFWYRLAGLVFREDADKGDEISKRLSSEQEAAVQRRLSEWKAVPIPPEVVANQLAGGEAAASLGHGWKHDFEGATVLLYPLAEQGNAHAQKIIAFMYYWGQGGVLHDQATALEWYLKAAELGDVDAMVAVADRYAGGQGVTTPQNFAEATKWYKKAAEQGNARAQDRLGEMYVDGEGVKDGVEGLKWLLKAADQGDVPAIIFLAERYENGRGIPQDFVEAYFWNNLSPVGHWGIDSLNGKLTPEQKETVEKRLQEFRKAHPLGDPLAE